METIKIIRGTYGFRQNKSGIISPKTVKDPPFEVDNKEAERLVVLGVAARAENEQTNNEGNQLYNKDMSLKDLQKIAEDYGVENASKLITKDKVISAIEEVLNGLRV